MKAFILAAGYGTRLHPITLNTPKCLVEIKGKKLLQWWLELLEKYGIDEILINTHYLPEQVEEFIRQYQGKIKIKAVYEKELLGSAGTIRANMDFVENEEEFLIIYADNLTNINLEKMTAFHHEKNADVTIGTFYTNTPQQCGIIEVDSSSKVISFEEKPEHPKSNHANAGIYIMKSSALDYFKDESRKDIGMDVLPKLIHKMYGYPIKEYLRDIGTIDNYKKANEDFKGI